MLLVASFFIQRFLDWDKSKMNVNLLLLKTLKYCKEGLNRKFSTVLQRKFS